MFFIVLLHASNITPQVREATNQSQIFES